MNPVVSLSHLYSFYNISYKCAILMYRFTIVHTYHSTVYEKYVNCFIQFSLHGHSFTGCAFYFFGRNAEKRIFLRKSTD